MTFNMSNLPEHILCQLFCDWLLISDISKMDVALCCHGFTREYLIKFISESSMLSPIKSCEIYFTLHYWLWLVKRKLFIKQLDISAGAEERNNFSFIVKNSHSSINRDIIQNTQFATIDNNNMSFLFVMNC
jgi:hypothetical protein